jgi:hypothetical protein
MSEMTLESLPASLRDAVEDDLQPIRPLHPAWMRTMVAVAFLAVVLAFVLAKASLRADIEQIPMWLSWGCSALQLGLGVLLIGMAMREAVPGDGSPAGAVRAAAVTALVVQILVGVATSIYSPAIAMPGSGFAPGIGCFKHEAMMALPSFAATLWLVFRALPLRAPTAGLLGGAGATVASDAVIHLLCPVSDLPHVLVWHSGAVIVFMALGWVVGAIWQRMHWQRAS